MKLEMCYYHHGVLFDNHLILKSNFYPAVGVIVYRSGVRYSVVNVVFYPEEQRVVAVCELAIQGFKCVINKNK